MARDTKGKYQKIIARQTREIIHRKLMDSDISNRSAFGVLDGIKDEDCRMVYLAGAHFNPFIDGSYLCNPMQEHPYIYIRLTWHNSSNYFREDTNCGFWFGVPLLDLACSVVETLQKSKYQYIYGSVCYIEAYFVKHLEWQLERRGIGTQSLKTEYRKYKNSKITIRMTAVLSEYLRRRGGKHGKIGMAIKLMKSEKNGRKNN